MTINSIELRRGFPVKNGGHILYVFNDDSTYLDNLMTFIMDGIKLGHKVLILEEMDIYQEIIERLHTVFSRKELENVYFEENGSFYRLNGNFEGGSVAKYFISYIDSLPDEHLKIKTWARVFWEDQEDIENNLYRTEKEANKLIQERSLLSVCAYEGKQISGDLMIQLLKNHDYFMTDHELIRSQFYSKPKNEVVFPSLNALSKIESEIDFYKRKLDFVHVVSHEVRNPLTIISAYANLLRLSEPDIKIESQQRLKSIEQYVKVIDQELTHIIETEQMLSNELYMKMEPLSPREIVHEVNELMSIKASVQNVAYDYDIELNGTEQLLGNRMGLRLIISNLISNAIKYTEEQGHVKFSVSNQNKQMEFVIKDNGIGMSDKELNSLFKKYGKMDERKSGQGIGLYVVKNLIDRFNGTILIESDLGFGTTVTVNFPLI